MPGIELGVSLEFHEVPTDGSFCSKCDILITGSMYQLYISVNDGDPLGFELLSTKYKICEPCKIKEDE